MTMIVRKVFTQQGRMYLPGDRLEMTPYQAQALLRSGDIGFPTAYELQRKTPVTRYLRRDLRADE